MFPQGTLARNRLHHLVEQGHVISQEPLTDQHIQPASIDLRVASEAYRLPGSLLPRPGEAVADLITELSLEQLDLSKPTVLARGKVYLVKLQESLNLPEGMAAYCNSKSSTGRVDLATRVLSDGNSRYDRIAAGYQGDLWCELIPRSFDIIIQSGESLNQAIFYCQRDLLGHQDLLELHQGNGLLFDDAGLVPQQAALYEDRVLLSADLDGEIVGYKAKRCHRPLDLSARGTLHWADYFTPISRPESGYLFLEKDGFYILASKEKIAVPDNLACEMVPYDPAAGEFRAHYAGFFDPGWGIRDSIHIGAKAVLEVRPHEDDLILRDGQPICAMAYERLTDICDQLYGSVSNNYAQQDGPRLSKHFLLD